MRPPIHTIPLLTQPQWPERSHVPASRSGEPVSVAIPFLRGTLAGHPLASVEASSGWRADAQADVLERWPDGSIRWLLLRFPLTSPHHGLQAHVSTHDTPAATGEPSASNVRHAGLDLPAGRARLSFGEAQPGPTARWGPAGEAFAAPALQVCSTDDCPWAFGSWTRTVDRGTVRTRVVERASATSPAGPESRLDVEVETEVYGHLDACRVTITLCNPSAARHPGGCWDLGDPASVRLRRVRFSWNVAGPYSHAEVSPSDEAPFEMWSLPTTLYQASSGGNAWNSSNHVGAEGDVRLDFRGYSCASREHSAAGERATPVVTLRGADVSCTVAAEYFWEVFPKALEAEAGALHVDVLPRPRRQDAVHEIQPGERLRFSWWIAFGDNSLPQDTLAWVRSPTLVHLSPTAYAEREAWPRLTPGPKDDPRYRALVDQAIDGAAAFAAKREVIDEFGWRHFGDVYGDHEAVRQNDGPPLVSHYNNQYDVVQGALLQFLRTADVRWWRMAREMAWHVADIDVYHTTLDKSAYNGGLFWHTVHYIDAGTATHRTYPARAGIGGGGPSGGHLYASGLALGYLLTGDSSLAAAAEGLGRYVISADDGTRTPFKWLSRAPTGHVTDSIEGYHGPGRASGNALTTLIAAHRLTGAPEYLDKIRQVVERCVHPDDDPGAHDLLDAERRWFYLMFLQALDRLLDHLEARDLRDDVLYAYARASLLRYAGWMVQHETLFLERRDRLEFPTETWAAQDMRKCDVFEAAARHGGKDDRSRYWVQARRYFEGSVTSLATSPTRALCRPVALLMTNGLSHAWHAEHLHALPLPEARLSPPAWPRRQTFVPQKAQALRRAKALAGAAVLLSLAAGIAAAASWLS